MANTGFKGINVRQTAGKINFRTALVDSTGNLVSTGTTSLYLYEHQDDGTLRSYDFNSLAFSSGTLTTETASMTHRTGNNSNTNTGIWTYVLSPASGFTVGGVYTAMSYNAGAAPLYQWRDFQYGSSEGDSNVQKNQALTNFQFLMTDSTNHAPATGKTVTVTRSIDGAAFAAGTLSSVTEVSDGMYKVDFGAGDLNGSVIILKATATGCDTTLERLITTT